MVRVPNTEFEQRLGDYEKRAMTEPVSVTLDGEDHLVLLSAREYRRLKARDRLVRDVADLSDAELAAIASSEVPPEHRLHEDEHE